MVSKVLSLDDYCVLTFNTTSNALKAERVLKDANAEFIIMPTLREISSSCGLSVKTPPENLQFVLDILARQGVPVEGMYHVLRRKRHNEVSKLEQVNKA
ncbi:MAG: DUF3343 domain-containing protein [Syntrophomonadaceae bacterium]|nr:DUF3343 domain-containing protein [Syntrophomonadaceae bacterium]